MKIIIGTHHKSGTVFFGKFTKAISKTKNLKVWDRKSRETANDEPEHWDIYFDHWSRWAIDFQNIDYVGIHSIRHPASLIYSAALYHCVSSESWLHRKQKELDNKTYSEHINALPMKEKLIFEMENTSRRVLERMRIVFEDKKLYPVKLEDISSNPEMSDLRNAFIHCGIRGVELDDWLNMASNFCLWNLKTLPAHSTTGVSEVWKEYFKGDVYAKYKEIFGELELELGYEKLV